MVPKALSSALFVRSGLDARVKGHIEREQQRERKKIAKLEEQLRDLQQANDAAQARFTKLVDHHENVAKKRYEDLSRKYDAARQQLDQQRERVAQLKEQVLALREARLEERVIALEHARRSDQQDRRRGMRADLEAAFPVPALQAHVRRVIAGSRLEADPYPHVVLNDVLPDAFHRMLYEARPSRGFWQSGQVGRENWTIGEDLGPLSTEMTWGYMDDVVAPHVLMPELTALFRDYLRTQIGSDEVADAQDGAGFEQSGGRLMLRRPGYTFEPHLDPPRALLTALLYFGTPQDSHEHGTKLFQTDRPLPEQRQGVYYPLQEGASCELVKTVPSRPNSMLVFASRVGLHGADIPADAQPSSLERYTYQFYIGVPRHKKSRRAPATADAVTASS